MTYREKWEEDHPDLSWTDEHVCPLDQSGNPIKCPKLWPGSTCLDCWNQEIPEDMKALEQILDEHAASDADKDLLPGAAKKMREACRGPRPAILDSGDRTEFATGAVRDMREGKGRCDLMPLEVASVMLGDEVLDFIKNFLADGNASWLYSAIAHAYPKMFRTQYTMLLEVAKHFEEGAKKYGENNWQKGIPVHCYIDSAVRHYLKWLRGDKDENHDRAFVWNLMCCIWEVDYSPRAKDESDPKKLQEKAQEILRAMGNEPIKTDVTLYENRLLPVTKAPDKVRLGDYTGGLFDFDGMVYAKANATPRFTCFDVINGNVRRFDGDILVTPLEIWEVDGEEDE